MVLVAPSIQSGTRSYHRNYKYGSRCFITKYSYRCNYQHRVVHNFTSPELHSAQQDHPVWKKVIYALESGDETYLPDLPVRFAQFSYQRTTSFVGDEPIAGHPRRVNTLSATIHTCYRPTLRVDVEKYVAQCVVRAKHIGSIKGQYVWCHTLYQGHHGK